MALIMVRHCVRRPVGDVHRFLSQLAASGGTMLVRMRLSDGASRAYPVLIDERRSQLDGDRGWWSAWGERLGVPGASGIVRVRADGEHAILEFHGSYATTGYAKETPHDVFAFRRASALARAYLSALDEGIVAATVAAA